MKALILAGGKAAHRYAPGLGVPKPLVPVANRPALAYLLDLVQAAGISQVGVVVADRDGPVASWPGWRRRPGMRFHFFAQSLPLGSAHALKVAQEFLGEEPFLALAGDCLLVGGGGLAPLLEEYRATRPAAAVLLAAVEDVSGLGVAEVRAGRVERVVEKPARPGPGQVLAGAYVADARLFAAIDAIRPSPRGELELTAALQHLIESGQAVRGVPFPGFWRDLGRPEAILEANLHCLDAIAPEVRGEVTRSRLEGRVQVGERARLVNSTVCGPAVIGEGSYVVNSWVGPYTAVGGHVVLEDCEVERSVILGHCRLRGVGRLSGSLLGEGNRVARRAGRPAALRLVLGCGNEVELP